MRPINLLPPEAFEKQRSRRIIARVSMIVVAYLALLVIVTIAWSGRIASAEQALAEQEAVNRELEAELAGLRPAAELLDRYEADAGLIETALATDVSWGRLLNDLGRMIPDRVWLESFNGTVQDVSGDPAAAGSIQVTGVGFDVPDISAWIRALDSDRYPGVGGGWVSSVTESTIGEAPVVRFVSQTALTDAARSGRAAQRIPEVGG